MAQTDIKQAVAKLGEAIQQNPNNAKLVYKADVNWDGDVRCTSKVRNLPTVVIDEPAAFGGGDTAQSPADLILTSLGSCQEIMYAALASAMDIPLDELKVELKGNLDLHGLFGMGADKGIPPGFQDISYHVKIKSPASEEQLKRLVDAVEKQCPILDTLTRAIKVTGKATINGATDYVGQRAA
ncbi:MAG: OsmC family protein [Burkholderiales bacterium]